MDRWAGMISIDPSGAFLGVGNKRMGLAGIASAEPCTTYVYVCIYTIFGISWNRLCIIGAFVCMYVCTYVCDIPGRETRINFLSFHECACVPCGLCHFCSVRRLMERKSCGSLCVCD